MSTLGKPITSQTILIVGGGPVGLTLACELARRGVACRIIDRRRERASSSRATDVHARTLEIFAELGVVDELIAAGKQVRGFAAYSEARELASIEFEGLETRYPFTLAVPQRETEAALEARLGQLGGGLERGLTLVELDQDQASEGVEVVLARTDGARERGRYRYVIACDGVRSSVREMLSIPFEGRTYTQRYLVGDFDIEWAHADDRVHLFMSREGFANVLALPGGRPGAARGRVLCDVPSDDAREPTTALFEALLRRRAGVDVRLSAPSSLASFSIQRRLAARYRCGAVLLAGDAAHTCSPLLGQGMNTGIQDAHNLGWKLALVVRGEADDALLDSYEAERRPVARAVLRDTHRMHVAATTRGPLTRRLRDLCIAASSRLGLARREAGLRCSELRQRYPVRALDLARIGARVDSIDAARAGTRVPDVEVAGAQPWRLHELIDRDRHTLLVLEGRRDSECSSARLHAVLAAARARFGDAVVTRRVRADARATACIADASVLDPDGAVHRRLGATRPCLLLLRPDAYIAARAPASDPGPVIDALVRDLGSRPQPPALAARSWAARISPLTTHTALAPTQG